MYKYQKALRSRNNIWLQCEKYGEFDRDEA